ncbi:hypothetical protein BDV30DRAFT_243577 [Aspergillus minisclerotigenes]|uniref:Amino acid/polyamine transporter I n=1 Tax=Aspergillus minisclerotigenes TaxID=656917 RepID=A0A5N6INH5_9EURO|nr:hypothetical protein BDV30DRAFT_243577 [Aspergillus minisclerotigenes]
MEDNYKNGEEMGTRYDQSDMTRMGKIQELKRNLRPLAALSFASVLQATWEFLLIGNTEALVNGGGAGLFWTYMWTFAGFGLIILTMSPTSGGQYHWVSELASPNYQRVLSYITGWMSVLAWQAGAASGSFLTGTIIQGLISVKDRSYKPENWQGTLFVFAMILAIYFFNVYAASWMPRIQNLLLALHILCFVVVITVLWAMAPRKPASAVFLEFSNTVNPKRKLPVNAIGLSCVISGLLALINIGSDTAFHAIISLNVAALMWTYVVSIGCLLYRRLSCPETLPPQRWSMGKYGIWVNAAALVYVVFAFFFSFWPTSTPVTLTTFNWSVVIFSAVFIISVVMYIFKGQKEYAGPVISVRRNAMPQARVHRHSIRREI